MAATLTSVNGTHEIPLAANKYMGGNVKVASGEDLAYVSGVVYFTHLDDNNVVHFKVQHANIICVQYKDEHDNALGLPSNENECRLLTTMVPSTWAMAEFTINGHVQKRMGPCSFTFSTGCYLCAVSLTLFMLTYNLIMV
jgi:hypothetical protein